MAAYEMIIHWEIAFCINSMHVFWKIYIYKPAISDYASAHCVNICECLRGIKRDQG